MARPIKNTVDYFPHIVNHGKTIFILESKFGNDGYAFWFKLLELLGSSDNHVYDYNNLSDWEFLIAKTKVSEEKAHNILQTLADVGAIDGELFEKKIIWCENFIKGIEVVYKNRRQETPKKPVITRRNPTADVVSTLDNPQSIVEDTIVEDSKEEIKEVPITNFKNLINNLKEEPRKEPKKANHIEFDFELLSWHGVDEDIKDRWAKIFPNVDIEVELMNIREFFKKHLNHEKVIKEKFSNNYAIYIFDWLTRAEKWKVEKLEREEGKFNMPETEEGG